MPLDLTAYLNQSNPFGSPFNDPFGSSFQTTLSAPGLPPIPPDTGPGEVDRGLIETLWHETLADVEGAGKFIGALGSEALDFVGIWDLMGMATPLEFEDLTRRDYTGAAMVAAMIAGGFIAKAARSLPAIADFTLAGQSWRGIREAGKVGTALRHRAAVTGGIEFLTGMTYGMLRPLEEGTDRVRQIFGDAALFGAFGAGFSVAGSALRATHSKVWGGMRDITVRRQAIEAATKIRDEQIIFELAGVRLRNPATGESIALKRNATNPEKIERVRYLADGSKQEKGTDIVRTFNEALADAFNDGYVERMGVARQSIVRPTYTPGGERTLLEFADEAVRAADPKKRGFRQKVEELLAEPERLTALQGPTGEILVDMLENVRLGEYAAVREMIAASNDAVTAKNLLNIDTVLPLDGLGVYRFPTRRAREDMIKALPGKNQQLAKLKDHELVQRAALNGTIDFESMAHGQLLRETSKDLLLSGYVPVELIGPDTILYTNSYKDLAFRLFTTTDRIVSSFPFMKDFSNYVTAAGVRFDEMKKVRFERIKSWKERYPGLVENEEKGRVIADLIDESGVDRFNAAEMTGARIRTQNVDAAAVRAPDGRVWAHDIHAPAQEAAVRAGVNMQHVDTEIGFIRDGKFYTMTQSRDIAEATAAGDTKKLQETLAKGKDYTPEEFTIELTPDEQIAKAKRLAEATGDPEIMGITEEFVNLFREYAEALGPKGVGRLHKPRIGYFPIFNVGKWRVNKTIGGTEQFGGFYTTREEALAAAVRARDEGATHVYVGPTHWAWTDDFLALDPKDYGQLQKRLKEAAEQALDEGQLDDLKEALQGKVVPGRAAPRTYAGVLQPRTLGIRDYAMADVFKVLNVYMGQADRVIGLHDFENVATKYLDAAIPQIAQDSPTSHLTNLRGWGEQLISDVMGRPRKSENIMDNTLAALGLRVKPRALRRWSSWVRRWESFSRLGGIASGIVNLTQISFNTTAKVGYKHTALAIGKLLDPSTGTPFQNFSRVRDKLVKLGVEQVEMFVPLSQEGGTGVHAVSSTIWEDIKRAAKRGTTAAKQGQGKSMVREYANAAELTFMFAFNGAERMNRVVTAYAQFLKSLDEQAARGGLVSERAAAAEANRMVKTTQFDYRMSNMPELFRDPGLATLFQFKSFLVNEIDFIAHLNKEELARFSASLMAISGMGVIMNMAPVDLLDSASSAFFHKSVSEALAIDVVGDRDNYAAKLFAYGVPGMFGVNITDYAGIGSVKEVTRGLHGPSVSDAYETWNFMKEAVADITSGGVIRDETRNAYLQKVLPSAIRRFGRAYGLLENGEVNDPVSGQLIYKPQDRARTAFFTGVGFPTVEYTQRRAVADVAGRVKERYIRVNRDLAREAAEAILAGEPGRVQNLRNRARERGFELTDQSIKYQIKNLGMDASERMLRRTPVQRRQEVLDALEVTGTLPEGYKLPESAQSPVLNLGSNPFSSPF